jgi:AcrR family transcriptional regulator
MNAPVRTLRRDAAERRAALMRAAREVFAELGIDAPLEAVADRAGVGRATLYRNFPDRTSLALAVLVDEIDKLDHRLATVQREQGDSGQIFFLFIDELADLLARNAALSGALRGVSSREVLEPLRHKIAEAGAASLARAQQLGLVRADFRPEDLRIIAALLSAGVYVPDEADRRAFSLAARRIVLDGLRSRP